MVTLAGAVIIVFSTFDMLDGQVARLGGMVSRFGALYDSVLDRYCELFTLGGIAFYITGMCVPNSQIAIYILVIAMAIIAVFANITAFARVDVCRKGLKENK